MSALAIETIGSIALVAGLAVGTYYAGLSLIGAHYGRREGESWLWLWLFLCGLVSLAAISITNLSAMVRALLGGAA